MVTWAAAPIWAPPSSPEPVDAVPPIFVIGAPADRGRLAGLLDGRDGISFAPDSPLLMDLAGAPRRHWSGLAHYGYPEQYWLRRVSGFFEALQMEYAQRRQLTRWVATARTRDLGLVDRLFPRCQVISVLAGRPLLGPARAVAADLGAARYLSVRSADLAARPASSVRAVLRFVG